MAVFRSLYLAFATLLFACTLAAPIPQHNPVFGEVVSVAPANTHGGVAIGPGAHIPHPHIAIGSDAAGNVVLAPVTHSKNPGLGPSMSANGMDTLTGNVLLNHVTAHPNNIAPAPGHHVGQNVGPVAVQAIHQTKALVQAHNVAAQTHNQAAQAHMGAQNAHGLAADQAHAQGNPYAAQVHANQAAVHQQNANFHAQNAANHAQAVQLVSGPNPHDYAAALHSTAGAVASHNYAVASHAAAHDH